MLTEKQMEKIAETKQSINDLFFVHSKKRIQTADQR